MNGLYCRKAYTHTHTRNASNEANMSRSQVKKRVSEWVQSVHTEAHTGKFKRYMYFAMRIFFTWIRMLCLVSPSVCVAKRTYRDGGIVCVIFHVKEKRYAMRAYAIQHIYLSRLNACIYDWAIHAIRKSGEKKRSLPQGKEKTSTSEMIQMRCERSIKERRVNAKIL